jgi:hypothetical protein
MQTASVSRAGSHFCSGAWHVLPGCCCCPPPVPPHGIAPTHPLTHSHICTHSPSPRHIPPHLSLKPTPTPPTPLSPPPSTTTTNHHHFRRCQPHYHHHHQPPPPPTITTTNHHHPHHTTTETTRTQHSLQTLQVLAPRGMLQLQTHHARWGVPSFAQPRGRGRCPHRPLRLSLCRANRSTNYHGRLCRTDRTSSVCRKQHRCSDAFFISEQQKPQICLPNQPLFRFSIGAAASRVSCLCRFQGGLPWPRGDWRRDEPRVRAAAKEGN